MSVDGFIQVPPDSTGKKVDNSVYQRDGGEIFRQRVDSYNACPANVDLDNATRVSEKTTLFDGKIYTAEDPYKWDTKGTGTATFSNNSIVMSVTAGQYVIRQGRFFAPYFSGKPQMAEYTQIDFHNQTGVVKRAGYFSSNAVAPYDSNKDGFWVEADGTTHRLICSNNGTIIHNIPFNEWDAVVSQEITSYDWTKFSVIKGTFLWLGGAGLQFFLVIDGKLRLMHTIKNHAGYENRLIFQNPNQPIRYEIRSTSGSGTLTSVCSQINTEGASDNEQGQGIATYSSQIAANSVGTIYPIIGARKQVAYRNNFCRINSFGASILTADAGVLMLLINPTLSAPMTWANHSRIQFGSPAVGSTVTNVGRILKTVPMVQNSILEEAPNALLRTLAVGIDNTMSELVVAYAPQTSNQTIFGTMQVLEY